MEQTAPLRDLIHLHYPHLTRPAERHRAAELESMSLAPGHTGRLSKMASALEFRPSSWRATLLTDVSQRVSDGGAASAQSLWHGRVGFAIYRFCKFKITGYGERTGSGPPLQTSVDA